MPRRTCLSFSCSAAPQLRLCFSQDVFDIASKQTKWDYVLTNATATRPNCKAADCKMFINFLSAVGLGSLGLSTNGVLTGMSLVVAGLGQGFGAGGNYDNGLGPCR